MMACDSTHYLYLSCVQLTCPLPEHCSVRLLNLSCDPFYFYPLGCLATAGALMYGLRAFQQGKTHRSQMLMRGRIAAQGFTVVALVVGVLATALKPKQ